MSKVEAVKRLTNRWDEQVRMFPTMRNDIPLSLYVAVNLQSVMRDNLLDDYREPKS